MKVFDLHCDSLYKSTVKNIPLNSNELEVKMNLKSNDQRLQCYAIWLPDDLSESEAEKLFFTAHDNLIEQAEFCGIKLITDSRVNESLKNNRYSAIFTIENGSALNGKIGNVKRFSDLGVKMITLTWNGHNSIGDGAGVEKPVGITEFGKRVIGEMEANNIVADISHASEKLFYDVAEYSSKPFVASHSNSFSVTPHKRNLTDEQFKIIVERGGLVGINFHKDFLNNNPEKTCKDDILSHIEHFLSLGGENTVCIGSDFDGCDLPNDIKNSDFLYDLYDMMFRKNYKESLIQRIFYENAVNFFENFDNPQNM